MRNVFVSYHQADVDEVAEFIEMIEGSFNEVRSLGADPEVAGELEAQVNAAAVLATAERIDSDNAQYVMRVIRERLISGTSCTIVLIGRCTWSRRFVDWELASTLKDLEGNPPSALLGIQLPSVGGTTPKIPERLKLNVERDQSENDIGYARYLQPAGSGAAVAQWVEDAVVQSSSRTPAAGSTTGLRQRSTACP